MHEAENVYDPGGEMHHEDNRLTYAQISEVPCFLAGTSVMTEQGMVPVDWLRPGDRLLTRDRGFQSLLWVGRFELGQAGKVLPPESRPVEIEAGALGGGQPSANLCVSPQHRLLLQHAQLQLCFGHEAMFCAADFLTGWPGVNRPERRGPLIYYHLLLPHHAAVLSDGQWTESLFLGDQMEEIVPPTERAELRRRAGAAGLGHEVTAYPCLRRWEVALLTPPQVAVAHHGSVAHLGRGAASPGLTRAGPRRSRGRAAYQRPSAASSSSFASTHSAPASVISFFQNGARDFR